MGYTNKQIGKILNIQEFVGISNTLSKIYLEFENKEYFIDVFTDRDRIYRVYCASIYNLIKAIQDSKEYFVNTTKYSVFEKMINQEFIATNNKYCEKENYKATLFKIIETIRHQVNHALRDDEDNNILFTAYIDFEILENLRIIINDIFIEVYNTIDKAKIKNIILNKPKIKYSMDKLTNKVDELKLRIPESENMLSGIFKEDNEKSLKLFDELFTDSNIYDLITKDPEAIKKFELADIEIQESLNRVEEYINSKGTELEKEALRMLREYMANDEGKNMKDSLKSVEEFRERLEKLFKSELNG